MSLGFSFFVGIGLWFIYIGFNWNIVIVIMLSKISMRYVVVISFFSVLIPFLISNESIDWYGGGLSFPFSFTWVGPFSLPENFILVLSRKSIMCGIISIAP